MEWFVLVVTMAYGVTPPKVETIDVNSQAGCEATAELISAMPAGMVIAACIHDPFEAAGDGSYSLPGFTVRRGDPA